MDTDSIIQIICIILLLAMSAFFSSAETSFVTVNKIKIRSLIDKGNKRAVIVDKIINNSGKMLSTILIGNNIVNLSASAISTSLVIRLFGNYATGIATGIITVLVLIFGEISPKNAATVHAEKIALAYAPIINALMVIFTPVIFIIDHLSGFVLKLLKVDPKNNKKTITEDELRTFVEVSHEDGVIESDEKQIINNLFDFGDTQAKDVMIPRIDMTVASIDSVYHQIINLFRETEYTRIPVYEDSADNIVGILNIKDFILVPAERTFNVKNIMREPYFTYEHKNVSDLFKEMQRSSHSVAIVLDEYGSAAGMITTEDLLEEIVGEIRDEYDKDETEPFIKLSENIYRVSASYKLEDINHAIGINLHSDDNDSIGGYIIEKLDRFPKRGDRMKTDNIEFIIEQTTKARIVSIIIKVQNQNLISINA